MKPYGTNSDYEASPKETPTTRQIRRRWKKQLKAKERKGNKEPSVSHDEP